VVPNKEVLRGLKPTTQTIYLWLCGHIDDKGFCYPSHYTLAKEAGISKRQAAYEIDELIEIGILCKWQRKDEAGDLTSNLYKIVDKGIAPPARRARHKVLEGIAAGADITKSIKQKKEKEMSSYDDAPTSSFKKKEIKTQTYLKNELRIKQLLDSGEFAKPKYDFSANGPYDWRYIVNHGNSLTPERYMLAAYWQVRNQYEILKQDFYFEMSYKNKDMADAIIKRDLKDARVLANCVEFNKLPKLIEIAEDKAWDEKKGEHAWEWKLHTLLKYIEQLPP